MKIDLHMHSTYSDGTLSPEELIKKSAERGLEVISLTDHDTTAGTAEAAEAAKKNDIEFIPGIEISTYRGEAEYHILGYFIDVENKELQKLSEEIIQSRIDRTKKIISKLNEMGYKLDYEDIKEYASGVSIGRPHIARALVKKGYIEEIADAFTDELIGGGSPAYVEKKKVKPETAVKTILKAGGIPVIAHPLLINHGNPLEKKDIEKLKKAGLKGIEVYQSKHDEVNTLRYKKIAEELNLLVTGGSDYHGDNSPGILPGEWGIDYDDYKKLKNAANK
ncbi:MAG: PHP domain-containing protein [Bacillota bacterium]